jgi:hypothetical protein
VPDPIYPAITAPTQDLASLLTTVQQLKEAVELLTGQRDPKYGVSNLTKNLEKTVGYVSAKFTEEIQLTNDGITALSGIVTTVSATANNAQALGNQASAFGQVTLKATATPGGASAAYGWYITAGDKYAGMLAGVDSVTGDAFIAFSAESLRFTNSGTQEPVFAWNATTNVFEFFTDVRVHDVDIALNAITNSASNAGTVASAGALTVTLGGIRAGARIEVETAVTDTSLSLFAASSGATVSTHTFSMSIDSGGSSGDMISLDTVAAMVQSGVAPYWTFYKAITPITGLFLITGLTAGSHTFAIANSSPFTLGMAIKVRELAR